MDVWTRLKLKMGVSNLVNICVDKSSYGEISGRIYQCYSIEPMNFSNVIQLVKLLDDFYDTISFPQAAVEMRTFVEKQCARKKEIRKITGQVDVCEHRGKKGTFLVYVQYRQNATWQGNVVWMEGEKSQHFRSALELLKLIDNALDA